MAKPPLCNHFQCCFTRFDSPSNHSRFFMTGIFIITPLNPVTCRPSHSFPACGELMRPHGQSCQLGFGSSVRCCSWSFTTSTAVMGHRLPSSNTQRPLQFLLDWSRFMLGEMSRVVEYLNIPLKLQFLFHFQTVAGLSIGRFLG